MHDFRKFPKIEDLPKFEKSSKKKEDWMLGVLSGSLFIDRVKLVAFRALCAASCFSAFFNLNSDLDSDLVFSGYRLP